MASRELDAEAHAYAHSIDETLKELQRKVREHERELTEVRFRDSLTPSFSNDTTGLTYFVWS